MPPSEATRFERLASTSLPQEAQACPEFLRHKQVLIAPMVLNAARIPFATCLQRAGEIVITFPEAYHAGFNHGFNIAESTNFASSRWLTAGRRARVCLCQPYSVRINMSSFATRVESFEATGRELIERSHAAGGDEHRCGYVYECDAMREIRQSWNAHKDDDDGGNSPEIERSSVSGLVSGGAGTPVAPPTNKDLSRKRDHPPSVSSRARNDGDGAHGSTGPAAISAAEPLAAAHTAAEPPPPAIDVRIGLSVRVIPFGVDGYRPPERDDDVAEIEAVGVAAVTTAQAGMIVDLADGQARVHYRGFKRTDDEWIEASRKRPRGGGGRGLMTDVFPSRPQIDSERLLVLQPLQQSTACGAGEEANFAWRPRLWNEWKTCRHHGTGGYRKAELESKVCATVSPDLLDQLAEAERPLHPSAEEGSFTELVRALENVRGLKTNSGVPIRDAVEGALSLARSEPTRQALRSALNAYKGNAAGTTKHAALCIADALRGGRSRCADKADGATASAPEPPAAKRPKHGGHTSAAECAAATDEPGTSAAATTLSPITTDELPSERGASAAPLQSGGAAKHDSPLADAPDRESLADSSSTSHGKSKRRALPASSSRRKQSKSRPKKGADSDDDEDMQLARALSLSLFEGGANAASASSEVDTDAAGSADAPEAPESCDDTDLSGAAYI